LDYNRLAMKNLIVLLLCVASGAAQAPAARPHITSIDHVAFYTTSPDGVKHLYADILGLSSADPIEPATDSKENGADGAHERQSSIPRSGTHCLYEMR